MSFSPSLARWIATGWTILILAACSIPGQDIPNVEIIQIDKFVHFTMFAVFGWLWMHAGTGRVTLRARIVILAGVAYAVLTEIYQGLLPWDRSPDPFDSLANTLGLLTAVAVYLRLAHRQRG